MSEAVLTCYLKQSQFDAFAALSGDNNPIHVDPEFAATTRFGQTVAHGAMLCAILRDRVNALAPGWIQVKQSVMYPAPTPAGVQTRFEAKIVDKTETRCRIALKVEILPEGEEPIVTCIGETELMR